MSQRFKCAKSSPDLPFCINSLGTQVILFAFMSQMMLVEVDTVESKIPTIFQPLMAPMVQRVSPRFF